MVGNIQSPSSRRLRSSVSRSAVLNPASNHVSPGLKGVRNQKRRRMSIGASASSPCSAAEYRVAMDSSDGFTSFENETTLVSFSDDDEKTDPPIEEDEYRSSETMVKWLDTLGSIFSSSLQILAPNRIRDKGPGQPVRAAFSLSFYDSANYAMDRGHIIMRIDQKRGHSLFARSTSHPEDYGTMQYAYGKQRGINAQLGANPIVSGNYGISETIAVTKPVRTMCQSTGTDYTEHGAGFLLLPVSVHGGRSEKICFELNITPRSVHTMHPIEFTATSYLRLRPLWKRKAKSKDEAIILVHSIHIDDICSFESTRDSYDVTLENDLSGYGPLVRGRLYSSSSPSSTRIRVGAGGLPTVGTVHKFRKMAKRLVMGKNEIEKNRQKVIRPALQKKISLVEMSASDGQPATSNIEKETLEVPFDLCKVD